MTAKKREAEQGRSIRSWHVAASPIGHIVMRTRRQVTRADAAVTTTPRLGVSRCG